MIAFIASMQLPPTAPGISGEGASSYSLATIAIATVAQFFWVVINEYRRSRGNGSHGAVSSSHLPAHRAEEMHLQIRDVAQRTLEATKQCTEILRDSIEVNRETSRHLGTLVNLTQQHTPMLQALNEERVREDTRREEDRNNRASARRR